MYQLLPGIKKIEYALADTIELIHYEKLAQSTSVKISSDFNYILIEGLAAIEYETKKVSGQDLYTTKLTFNFSSLKAGDPYLQEILLRKKIVYKLTDINGCQYLLGTHTAPYPTATIKYTNQNEPSGSNLSEFEITYSNLFPFLKVI